MISCSHDGEVYLWDTQRWFDRLHFTDLHTGWILSVDISPTNMMAATSLLTTHAYCWRLNIPHFLKFFVRYA